MGRLEGGDNLVPCLFVEPWTLYFLLIHHIVSLEVLETSFIYLWEGNNVVEPWSHVYSLSLGHYGTREQHWGAYPQTVAQFSMKMMLYCWKYNIWWA